jgi:hypothetical protein
MGESIVARQTAALQLLRPLQRSVMRHGSSHSDRGSEVDRKNDEGESSIADIHERPHY